MALDPIMHGNAQPRTELEAMKDKRAELVKRFAREPKHSDAWFEMAGNLDLLADEIYTLEQELIAEQNNRIDRIRAFQMGGHSGRSPWDADA